LLTFLHPLKETTAGEGRNSFRLGDQAQPSRVSINHNTVCKKKLGRIVFLFLPALDFTVDVPHRFLQVFDGVVLQVGTPDVLDRVAKAEVHVFRHLNALDVAGV
jgi:hypothetical protein